MNEVEHVPAVSKQLVELSEPSPVELKVTVPVGVIEVPSVDVSVTVTVHREG